MIRTSIAVLVPAIVLGVAAHSSPATAQASPSDLLVRIDQLENQVRQLTGSVEQLQYRNQQLEQALRRVQEDTEFRFQELGSKGAARSPGPPMRPATAQPAPPPIQPPAAPGVPARRSDVFEPGQNPTAPGAPRVLGSLPAGAGGIEPPTASAPPEPPIGVPGGRAAGAPLDLSTLAGKAAADSSLGSPQGAPPAEGVTLPPPPPRNPNATGVVATLPPSQTPRDEYDLAYGYLLRKDYALAEDSFRAFLKKYSSDRLAPEALYWLGETLFHRQNYRDAADTFLTMSKKYERSPKAAESLLRLGQSLAALHEKELACATFGEVTRKYPRAAAGVKQAVEREQKRVRC